jgi:hypothetical protein
MANFTFDIPPDNTPGLSAEAARYQRILLEKARRIDESARKEREEEARRAAMPKSRVVTLRMPIDLIEGLDHVAADAATNRGHLLRQIASDYLNYVRANGIVYRGSLMSFRGDPKRPM